MTGLRKLAEAATPGPWWVCGDRPGEQPNQTPTVRAAADGTSRITVCRTGQNNHSPVERCNAAFIAACSPDRILALLDRAERAERERDALQRHYDAAGPEHNLLSLLDCYQDEIVRLRSERCEACDESDATIERLTAERMGAAMRANAAERERDEAIEDRKQARDDAARAAAMLAARTMERDEARAELAAVTAERDAARSDLDDLLPSLDAHALMLTQVGRERDRAEAALARAMEAMPSDGDVYAIREALTWARVHGYPRGERVGAWLARLDAFRASQAATKGGEDG